MFLLNTRRKSCIEPYKKKKVEEIEKGAKGCIMG